MSRLAALARKLWGRAVRTPAPSPVLASHPQAPRWSMRSSMVRALVTISWLAFPLMWATNPTPQASFSNAGRRGRFSRTGRMGRVGRGGSQIVCVVTFHGVTLHHQYRETAGVVQGRACGLLVVDTGAGVFEKQRNERLKPRLKPVFIGGSVFTVPVAAPEDDPHGRTRRGSRSTVAKVPAAASRLAVRRGRIRDLVCDCHGALDRVNIVKHAGDRW